MSARNRLAARIDRTNAGLISTKAGLTAVIVLTMGFAIFWARDFEIESEFYAVVAQVLPVFLLVAAVDGRFFRDRSDHHEFHAFAVRARLMMLLIGEAAALTVIARGGDSDVLRGAVLFSLVGVGVAFFLLATQGPVASDATTMNETRSDATSHSETQFTSTSDFH